MALFRASSKGKPRLETDASEITIGTRTSCDLVLRDPIAAERHARIVHEGFAFRIEDLGTATGTYVDGLALEGPRELADGSEVLIGVNKLVAKLEREGDRLVLALDLQEDKFFQKARMAAGDAPRWVPGDREAFKEAEIEFSAFPALRAAVWGAVLVAVLLLLALAVPPVRAALVQPGPLHNLHAQHLGAGDCAACHEPYGGAPAAKCAACHAEHLAGRHPFDLAAVAEAHPGACAGCHVEHMGTRTELAPAAAGDALPAAFAGAAAPLVRRRDPRYTPPDFRERVGCAPCHDDVPDLEAARRRAAPLERPEPSGEHGPARRAAVAKFSHASHVGQESIACAACHAPAGAEAGALQRDFAVVPFETCMGCHQAEDGGYRAPGLVVDERFAGRAPAFRVDWHGTSEEGCGRCHADPGTGTRRTVSRAPRGAEGARPFDYRARGHVEEQRARARECARCHGSELVGSERSPQPFLHALHLARLPGPDASREDAQALSASCAECHAGAAQATTLRGVPAFDDGGCAACHGEAPRRAEPAGAPVESPDFPHDLHGARPDGPLARGCFACHSFAAPGDGAGAAPVTPPEVRDCTACHADHANVGGGRCQVCHEGDDPLFFAAPPAPRPGASFSHFTPDHAAALDDCAGCHAGVAGARTVAEVSLPDTSAPACFACHFERRFHWR